MMTRVPLLRASLALSPNDPAIARDAVERSLLRAIDGRASEPEIATRLGLEPSLVRARVDRLLAVGALELGPEPEVVELDPKRQREIVELLSTMDAMSHYGVLGLAPDATKKQIKSAYFAKAPQFHPDRYFRKQLGSFRPRIEAIFSRLTVAHDVLSNDRAREEYDRYLGRAEKNRAMEGLLAEVGPAPEAVAAPAEPEAPRARPVSLPPPSLAERRQAFARRLSGTPPPPRARVAGATPTPPPAAVNHDALRVHYEAAKAHAIKVRLAAQLDAAREALKREDYAAAVNAYRVASSLAPEDAEVQRAYTETKDQAAKALAEGFREQADYEAEHERWAEAALSYARVCDGRPDDALAHERVAFATIKAGGNVRRAVEFVRRAVQLAPESASIRATAALVYAAAGLDASARGEAARALTIDPKASGLRRALKDLL